jgi:hypothetical protein
MIILRTTENVIIVIEQNEMHFYNSKDMFMKERIFLSLSILCLVALNIVLGKTYDSLLWLSLWVFLFITWIAYLLFHLLKGRYPDKIKFMDIHKIRYAKKNKAVNFCICSGNFQIKFRAKVDHALEKSTLSYFKNHGVDVEEIFINKKCI